MASIKTHWSVKRRSIVLAGTSLLFAPQYAFTQPVVNVREMGAHGDGSRDDTDAIASAIRAASLSNGAVYLPAGIYSYSDVIRAGSVRLIGEGEKTTIQAMNPSRGAVMLTGKSAEIVGITFTSPNARSRLSNPEAAAVCIFEAEKFSVSNCIIRSAASAGILNLGGTNGKIFANKISGTLADGIHNTKRAQEIDVFENNVTEVGDDGIAVVSYKGQGAPCSRIRIRNNVIFSNRARGIAVVGGEDVLIVGNRCESTLAAGILLAQEDSWNTLSVSRVDVLANLLVRCAVGFPSPNQAPILLNAWSGAVSKINIEGNKIVGVGHGKGPAVRVDQRIEDVTLAANTFETVPMGIRVNGRNVRITKNLFTEVSGPCVSVEQRASGICSIKGNTFRVHRSRSKQEPFTALVGCGDVELLSIENNRINVTPSDAAPPLLRRDGSSPQKWFARQNYVNERPLFDGEGTN